MPSPIDGAQRIRLGESKLSFDPADSVDAKIAFIGKIKSGWNRQDCPKNIRLARQNGKSAYIELKPGYQAGLAGLSVHQHVMLLYWMDRSRRDLILQTPGHVDGPRGVFSIRSPARPNPIGLACVQITALDFDGAKIGIDAIDCLDGTPLLDIKPWLETIDAPPRSVIA